MTAIRANVEITEDGGLRLLTPLPGWVKPGVAEIVMLSQASEVAGNPPRRPLEATHEMLEARRKAFDEVRRLDPYREISDPVAWQRDMRVDAVLPGRD